MPSTYRSWQLEGARPIPGELLEATEEDPDVDEFAKQAGCQHTCGYYRGLKLDVPGAMPKILSITSSCPDWVGGVKWQGGKRGPEEARAALRAMWNLGSEPLTL